MKEIYEEPKLVIIDFESSDVLTASDGTSGKTSNDIGEWDIS